MVGEQLLRQNEIEINIQNRRILKHLALIAMMGCIVVFLNDDPRYYRIDAVSSLCLICAFLFIHVIQRKISEKSQIDKYLFIIWTFFPIMIEVVLSTDFFWIAFALPILLSCRYYNIRFVVVVSVVTQIALVISTWGVAYIQPMLGYARANSVCLPEGVTIVGDGRWLSEYAAELIMDGTINRFEYMLNIYSGHVVFYAIILLAISACCILITKHEIQLLNRQSELLGQKHEVDIKLAESKYRVLISQIQPHFLFNILSSVIALCSTDPQKAEEMLLAFSSYLRYDIDSLSATSMIPFERELKSVKDYLKIEQMRFGERIKVVLDTEVTNFMIQPLSIQPLVENAVKHGICKKRQGGTVWIRTRENEREIIIEIEDDGVGFDVKKAEEEGSDRVGLSNVRARLESIMNAKLVIQSEMGKGTLVKVSIPKKVKKN